MTAQNSLQPLPSELLTKLFSAVGIQVPREAVKEACAKTASRGKGPVDQLGAILTEVSRRNARAAFLRWDRFDRRRFPALLWRNDAWFLAEEGKNGRIVLTGEDSSREDVPADEVGDALVLWVQIQTEKQRQAFQALKSPSIRLLLRAMTRRKRWIVDVLVATVVVNVLAVMTSLFTMQVYDRVVPSFAYATLWALAAGMGIVISLDWILKRIRAGILDTVARDVDREVSDELFDHLLRLRLDTRPRSLGTMAAQVNGLESVRAFFTSSIVFSLTDFPFALLFIVFIAIIGGPIAGVYVGLLIFGLLIGFFSQFRMRELSRREIARSHERHGVLVDSIQGAETIQACGAEWRFSGLWRDITETIASYGLKSRMLASRTQTTAGTMSSVAYVLAIIVGVMQIEQGQLSMGGLIACSILGGRVMGPVAQGVQNLMQWQHVRESLQMVDGLLGAEENRPGENYLLMPEKMAATVQFDGVRFAYPDAPVLRLNIGRLSFKAGDRVAILGANGSGKSTFLKVAAGMYRPSSGQLRLGGADIWDLDRQVLNQWVGYLPQDVHLFKGTLRSNITLAGGFSDTRLIETIRMLGIDRIASDNPRGMDMEISEGGQGLSSGQKQIVGLSRLFLSEPTIWLLDEPSAFLDDDSEKRILAALSQKIRPDDILLMATHRPRMVSLANRMIIMSGGQVAADGKPADILRMIRERTAAASREQTVLNRRDEPVAAGGGENNEEKA